MRLNILALFISVLFMLGCGSEEVKEKQVTKPKTVKKQEPLFKMVSSQESGIRFKNNVPETKGMNILTYEYLYNGGGVAIGDINNDGLPDIFFSTPVLGGRLFLNQGGLKFKNITKSARININPFTTGVSMVDINEDGYMDIYVCRSASGEAFQRENILLINNKDLTFTNRAHDYGLDDDSFSNYASFIDYDKDGDLDLFLLNHRYDFKAAVDLKQQNYNSAKSKNFQYTSDRLYRNNGDETFTDVTKQAGLQNSTYGLSVTAADLNEDGWVDLFVANDYADKDHLYINNKNGTFTDKAEEMLSHFSKNAMGSDIADFNNDGLLDIINLDMISEDNYRQKQLKSQTPYDLYHMMVKEGYAHQIMRNTLQLNNGDGTFSEIGQLAGISHTDWSWTPLLADFDNDGYKDLFITNGYYRDVNDMDFIKYESNKIIQEYGGLPNVDNLEMVKHMNSVPIKNYVYRNNGDLSFTDMSAPWGINKTSFSNGAVYADLDLDGDLDIIINNFNDEAFLYENTSESTSPKNNSLSIDLKGPKSNPHGVGAKLELTTETEKQFQYSSPYRGYFSSVDPVIHFGLGDYNKADLIVTWPDGKVNNLKGIPANERMVVSYADAKKQSLPPEEDKGENYFAELKDVLVPSYTHKESDYIDFKREPLLEHMISNKGPFLSKGDVNGDRLEDIFIGGAHQQAGALYIQQEDGRFTKKDVSAFKEDAVYEDANSVFFDVDNDGDQDLYVVSGGYQFEVGSENYLDRLYLNDGKGTFSRSNNGVPQLMENGLAVAAEDFDKDGDLDLFIGGNALPGSYPKCSKSYLLINDSGVLKEQKGWLPKEGYLGMINDAKMADIDADGSNELVLAGEWMPITVLKKKGNSFEDVTFNLGLTKSSGWWNVIKFKDIDNDGDLDFIAGNRGNNSFYRASEDRPAIIYAIDLDGNGSLEAIPFYYFRDGRKHPKHLLDEIFTQFPGIRGKFPRYEDYSNASETDLFTQEELNRSIKIELQTFSTSLFINQGTGIFNRVDLPKSAQLSEAHGLLIEDINGDGNYDIVVTGNNFGTDVEMGRSDASIGSVLIGNGNGDFKSLTNLQSGFNVKGDSRGINRIGNDKSVIMILRNGDSPVFYDILKKQPL